MVEVHFVGDITNIPRSIPPQIQGIYTAEDAEKVQIFSKLYNFMLALSEGMCYTLHSGIEVFTFSEVKKMTGICPECGEYYKDLHEYEDDYLCEYCIEDAEEQKERDNQADLLFQSLTIGEPDLFSDEMRWFWGV